MNIQLIVNFLWQALCVTMSHRPRYFRSGYDATGHAQLDHRGVTCYSAARVVSLQCNNSKPAVMT